MDAGIVVAFITSLEIVLSPSKTMRMTKSFVKVIGQLSQGIQILIRSSITEFCKTSLLEYSQAMYFWETWDSGTSGDQKISRYTWLMEVLSQ